MHQQIIVAVLEMLLLLLVLLVLLILLIGISFPTNGHTFNRFLLLSFSEHSMHLHLNSASLRNYRRAIVLCFY